jgi:tight adherence protein B
MIRALGIVPVAVAVLVAAGPAGADMSLTPGAAQFPGRSFVLNLPKGQDPAPGDVRVTENGKGVEDLSVTTATAAGHRDLAEVLVIDASSSMHGAAISGAMGAARAFAQQRNPNQELGVVFFNNDQTIALAPTNDSGAITAALANAPTLAHGTRIYDAVAAAARLLHDSQASGGSIVVLSDGSDTGSNVTTAQAVAAARAAHARVFSIGLRSGAFDASTLEQLTRAGGGRYAEATSAAALAPIFRRLAQELTHVLLIRYRSPANPGKVVAVDVHAGPVAAHTSYRAPRPSPSTLTNKPVRATFWTSTAALFLVSLIVGLVCFVGARAIQRRPRESATVRGRVSAYAVDGDGMEEPELAIHRDHALPWIIPKRWRDGFTHRVALAQIERHPSEVALVVAGATALLALVLIALAGTVWTLPLAIVVPVAFNVWLAKQARERREIFAEQLPDSLQIVASAMRTGQSFVGALSVLVEAADEPSRSEFRRVVADEQLGVPLDRALYKLTARMGSRDLDQLAVVATIQRETGGNAAEAIDRIVETVRERAALRRLVSTLTAQGRLVRWILTGLPIALLIVLTIANPTYMKPLLTETWGRGLLLLGATLVTAGSLWIKRIVEIEV